MSYSLDQALALIGTPEYSSVDGLRRLVAETSATPTGGAGKVRELQQATASLAGLATNDQAWRIAV